MDRIRETKAGLKRCRILIEQKLQWIDSSNWTRREYEALVEYIYSETGVLLSLSTVRRIWNDDFKNIPQKNTLDALAVCAGFTNWMNFLESKSEQKVRPKINRSYFILIIGIVVLIGIIYLVISQINNQEKQVVKVKGDVLFEYAQQNDTAVPNIVVFDYDVENIVADSFFIVESTHNYERKKLNKLRGSLTSAYFHPGIFEAFLLANDSVIRKLDIKILSNGWVATVNYRQSPDLVPFYFYGDDIIDGGKLSVTRDILKRNNIRIQDDLFVTLSHTFKSDIPIYNDYRLSTKVKLDSIEINSSSPEIYLGLLFEHDVCFVPLIQNGGQGDLQVKFGNTILTSNDSDLSGFGCNIYEWQEVEINSKNDSIAVFINDRQILRLRYSSDMGAFHGFSFNFEGVGSIDFVSLCSLENDTIYYNRYND